MVSNGTSKADACVLYQEMCGRREMTNIAPVDVAVVMVHCLLAPNPPPPPFLSAPPPPSFLPFFDVYRNWKMPAPLLWESLPPTPSPPPPRPQTNLSPFNPSSSTCTTQRRRRSKDRITRLSKAGRRREEEADTGRLLLLLLAKAFTPYTTMVLSEGDVWPFLLLSLLSLLPKPCRHSLYQSIAARPGGQKRVKKKGK